MDHGAAWHRCRLVRAGAQPPSAFEFGTFTDRFERLEEALQIITGMLRGDRPTLEGRLYAVRDAINSPAPVEVLDAHCAKLGRDRSDITVTYQTSVAIAPTREQAIREADEAVARIPEMAARRPTIICGDPDDVAAAYERIMATGVDGVTVNLPTNCHIEGRVRLLGQTLASPCGGT